MIQSPLNYTGGKYKLLPQILPLFPKDIDVFVDLFCGGCNVGVNVDCDRVIYNDLNENLLYLYNTFKNLDKESVLEWIYEIIEKYNLSLVSKHGYDYYGCESSKVLGNYNREGYLRLRADFNQKHTNENFDYYYYVMLYVIIVYAFNNQIRFNSNGECQSLGGVQGALFKGRPCWGRQPQLPGQRPTAPSESAIASFDGRRLSKVLLSYFRRK